MSAHSRRSCEDNHETPSARLGASQRFVIVRRRNLLRRSRPCGRPGAQMSVPRRQQLRNAHRAGFRSAPLPHPVGDLIRKYHEGEGGSLHPAGAPTQPPPPVLMPDGQRLGGAQYGFALGTKRSALTHATAMRHSPNHDTAHQSPATARDIPGGHHRDSDRDGRSSTRHALDVASQHRADSAADSPPPTSSANTVDSCATVSSVETAAQKRKAPDAGWGTHSAPADPAPFHCAPFRSGDGTGTMSSYMQEPFTGALAAVEHLAWHPGCFHNKRTAPGTDGGGVIVPGACFVCPQITKDFSVSGQTTRGLLFSGGSRDATPDAQPLQVPQ
jgi:hypothetical protein